MSDITMCEGVDCPIRSKCYRYTAMPDYYQYYFIETPFEYDYCEKFISAKEEKDQESKKFVNTREDGTEYSFSKEPKIKIMQTSNADMNIGLPMKQTAVEWLVEQYANENYGIEVYEQAKQMEKEQIKEAWIEGGGYSNLSEESDRMLAEQYYKETYEQK